MDKAATDKFFRGFNSQTSLVKRSKPKSTQYKDQWAVYVFQSWQAAHKIKFPALKPGSVFEDYNFHCVQGLEERLEGLDSLSFN